jgi:hypothetical protein
MTDGSVVVSVDLVWNAGLAISKYWDQKMFEEHFKCHSVYLGEHRVVLTFQNKADASMFLLKWS